MERNGSDDSDRIVASEAVRSDFLGALAERRKWFDTHTELCSCPCCGYPTLGERGHYHICPICEWEDDGQDDPNADEVMGGPNYTYSLAEARRNFHQYAKMYRPEPDDPWPEASERQIERVKRVTAAYDAVILAQDPERRLAAWRLALECQSLLTHGEIRCRHHTQTQALSFNEESGEWLCWECLHGHTPTRFK